MKKLKKFVLNDAKMLSREELASIEGSLTISALDNCATEKDKGKACVYYTSNEGGHTTIVLGTCAVIYTQVGSHVVAEPYCA